MSVYDFNCRRSDTAKLYRGRNGNRAVDLPPEKNESCVHKDEIPVSKPKRNELLEKILEEFWDGKIDSDKLLIAALLYMLIKEGADIKLIIALGYILM